MRYPQSNSKIDWWIIILYFALVGFGWLNIYSASMSTTQNIWDLNQIYSKQLVWILLSVVLIVFILAVEAKFYERFSSLIYLFALAALVGLYVFGQTVNGATSWYAFGGFSIQPSEFAKTATALALGKFVGDIQTNIRSWQDQWKSLLIMLLPALLIIPQPDPGSALVYAAFILPLYREGLNYLFLTFAAALGLLFIGTLLFEVQGIVLLLVVFLGLYLWQQKRKRKRIKWGQSLIILALAIGFAYSVNYVFYSVFEQRHRDRINLVLGKTVDSNSIGYNTHQSEIAIGSGRWWGKGWLQGTQTKGNFVPEQHTDYIFSTVGEEWGFMGALFLISLFIALILRVLYRAEKQKSIFGRVYGYSVASIIFIHFMVNIGMVIGLLPTVGIPLPFISYGGSGLWGFTILLFIFVKLDSANYINIS
ncbi:MAG: rod shape-determining protein RodA [Bacteroidetes bacterium]|jgi:rod shape determining protein RodA|nr:rod shape-determining protein RodA [Flavobacteriaceae bacterium]MDA0718557.1 rod shape-determining protein RodA [Bacteroidota bacterium]MDA0864138.1 rod shape-determining protein RodA [Bacteroidota bacterium]HCK06565.1 rod shape-determining protein RodA [Flavobacteriaceae bacterium]